MCVCVCVCVAGNTNPYLVSYIRNASSPADLQYIDGVWIQACMLMGQGVSMFLGGVLEVKLGPRLATLIGAWFLRSVRVNVALTSPRSSGPGSSGQCGSMWHLARHPS